MSDIRAKNIPHFDWQKILTEVYIIKKKCDFLKIVFHKI